MDNRVLGEGEISPARTMQRTVVMKIAIFFMKKVQAAVDSLKNFSASNSEETVFNSMLKSGGEAVVKGLHYIIQKCWSKAVLQKAFIMDAKVMLPKPGKSNYNSVRSDRPITLESVIGKMFERVVTQRLMWKLEVEEGIAHTQSAYRKQKSCVPSVLRVTNDISEAKSGKEDIILTVMYFDSCYERIWRAGLLHKASKAEISGRIWIYIKISYMTEFTT